MRFKQVTYNLTTLVDQIEIGSIGLPELQRPFVWNRTKIRDLFDSMYKGFPVGFLLLWQTGVDPGAKQIGVGNKQKVPSSLVVDGQQRLTSLYAVLKAAPVVGSDYKESKVDIAFQPSVGKFDVTSAAHRRDPEWIPNISEVWSPDTGLIHFANSYVGKLREAREVSVTDEAVITGNIQRLHAISNFQFIALELAADLDEEQVADIFVRINSEGVRLNQADFILTLMSVWDDKGRKELEEFCRRAKTPSAGSISSPFNWFIEPSPDQLLRVAIALAFRRARLSQVYSVLRGKDPDTGIVDPELRDRQFEQLRSAQDFALDLTNWHEFLKSVRASGYQSAKMLTSQTALIYTYAIFLIGRRDFGLDWDRLKTAISRWFFMVALTSRYSSSSETQMELDMSRLRKLDSAEEFLGELDRVCKSELTSDFWDIRLPNDLDRSGTRSPALFAFDASLCLLNTPALFSRQSVLSLLDPSVSAKKSGVERHHLFPRAYLDSLGFSSTQDKNQLANYALVEWHDNITIGARPPSEYMEDYGALASEGGDVQPHSWLTIDKLERMQRQHALPVDWQHLSYRDFLEQRRVLISQVIRRGWETLGLTVEVEPKPIAEQPSQVGHWETEDLIKRLESNRVEFKSSARWSYYRGEQGKECEDEVIKTVGAFMNSHGGTLVIGVEDDGNVLGIDKDLATVKGKSLDGFDLWLHKMLDDAIGIPEIANLVSVSFVDIEEKVLCRVDVKASDKPIYVVTSQHGDVFYIRSGAASKRLSTKEAHEYIAGHWGML
jgi:hypothetical protein